MTLLTSYDDIRAMSSKVTGSARRSKIGHVMREFRAGKLKSSSGYPVASESQAAAIAMSEARRLRKRNGN